MNSHRDGWGWFNAHDNGSPIDDYDDGSADICTSG